MFPGFTNLDDLVKSQIWPVFVIPAKAGIQLFKHVMDSRLRGNDKQDVSRLHDMLMNVR